MDVKDGIIGFAIGDALGVPVEFLPREILTMDPVLDMQSNGTHKQPAGTWSDDTSMILATMDGIVNAQEIDYYEIANNFCLWASGKMFNPHDKLFDIGITTHKALQNYVSNNIAPTLAGENGYYDNGNGSLMRILPLAYYFKENPKSDYEMADIVDNLSSITHRHEISCMGCYLYTKYALALLDGKSFEESYEALQKVDTTMYSKATGLAYKRVLNGELKDMVVDNVRSSGFVIDSLEASIWCCLHSDSYEDCVLKAVNLGGDTDTIAGLAGGLAGIKYGLNNIPQQWLDTLVKKDYIEALANNYQRTIEIHDKDVTLKK